MTLKRREKRRYISMMYNCSTAEAVAAIEKRLQELYGAIALARASLKVISSGECHSLVRCNLGSEEKVLTAAALANPPVVTLDMSSSMKRLKKRLTKVNTALLAKKSRG